MFGIIFWRYLSRATRRERLLITEDSLAIITDANGKKEVCSFKINLTTGISFVGFQQAIDHPLKTDSLDYLGFQTEQKLINAATDEGNLALEHDGKIIRFGVGIPSWDVVQLNELLQRKTKGLLCITNLPEEIPESEWNSQPLIR